MNVWVASLLATAAATSQGNTGGIKNVKLNNGVEMPMLSLGTWQYNSSTAEAAVKLALQAGFNHIDTAMMYNNQDGVGAALKGVDRKSYFLTTKVPPAFGSSAYAETTKDLQGDLSALGLDYVDLMLVHGPARSCTTIQEQWRALEDFYKAGKAKAIGVSNFCLSSFKCVMQTAKITPVVNQIKYHVGMGPDPEGLKSHGDSLGVLTQAYSPLADGSSELITGSLVSGIGKGHGWSGAQVSMRWIIENGVALTTKTTKLSHMKEDLAIFSDSLSDAEKKKLDDAKSPSGTPSAACSSEVSANSRTGGIKNVKLNNGVEMPMLSLGTWQYSPSTAEAAVKLALQAGFNHIDTAMDYNNQDGVGAALKGVDRKSYFLTTKVPPVQDAGSAYAETAKNLQGDLSALGLAYVDLMLVHVPARSCKAIQEQWRALEDFYKAGKTKAIGVSNFCVSTLNCVVQTATITPAVNQIEYHVGMGPDPEGLKSHGDSLGVVTQAYSPLGDGTSELITGSLVSGIGKGHGWSGAQVSMRWIIENGVAISTKTTKLSHMKEDLAIFSDSLEDAEKKKLDDAKSPSGTPSFVCRSEVSVVVV